MLSPPVTIPVARRWVPARSNESAKENKVPYISRAGFPSCIPLHSREQLSQRFLPRLSLRHLRTPQFAPMTWLSLSRQSVTAPVPWHTRRWSCAASRAGRGCPWRPSIPLLFHQRARSISPRRATTNLSRGSRFRSTVIGAAMVTDARPCRRRCRYRYLPGVPRTLSCVRGTPSVRPSGRWSPLATRRSSVTSSTEILVRS